MSRLINGITEDILQTKYYAFGDYEKEVTPTGTRHLHYISGGDGLAAIYVKYSNAPDSLYFIVNDHLGSIVGAINSTTGTVYRQNFDSWGRKRNPVTWSYTNIPDFPFDHGYTGHEHLKWFGLINMNGRMYDAALCRFLSPDPYVQMPDYTQNFNRYSYALNNPLIYSDPSGEILWFVPLIYAAVNVGVDMILNDGDMNFGEIAMSAGMGAVGGFLAGTGINTVGKAFLSAGVSQVNRLLPSVPIYQSDQFNLSVSPMVGFGSSGFNFGGSLNASGQIGDFAYSTGVGAGYNSGVSSLGEGVGGSGFWNAGGFAGWNDGHASYGAGYSYNSFGGKTAQGVGAITAQIGDFSLRIDEDYIGDGFDRYRTGGALATYKVNNDFTIAFGGSMMTGMAGDKIAGGNPNVENGLYTDEDYKLRGGTMYGGVNFKGQSYFAGNNSEKRLHNIQNWIHRNVTKTSPYFPDLGFQSKIYSYYGGYNPYYLFY
jgi:RHS repeat-associated protein